ncbi:MAG: glycosyltransferase family 4 protein [Pirellulales bacterium]|nr:glycosyltransferase family 4 protein [Pirellulales bacterium]
MPRVLWLFELAALNGAERSLLACLAPLRATGWEILAAAPAQGPLASLLAAEGVRVYPLTGVGVEAPRRTPESIGAEIASILDTARPDLVHANSLAMGRHAAAPVQRTGRPSLVHLRDIVGLSRAAVAALNTHRRLLAVSSATREFHLAQGIEAARCHVLYNGVDERQFRPGPATGYLHQELDLPRSAKLVGNIGQLGLRKGQDVLLDAFAELAAGDPSAHLVIVGERHSRKAESIQFEQDLHDRAAAAGLDARVHFLGLREDVAQILPELTVLASTARQEPLGRVLLEGAACGCAIVATDVGGTREIFPPESNSAWLIEPDDPRRLARALAELFASPSRRQEQGTAARRRIEECFTIALSAEALGRHYQQLIAADSAASFTIA